MQSLIAWAYQKENEEDVINRTDSTMIRLIAKKTKGKKREKTNQNQNLKIIL